MGTPDVVNNLPNGVMTENKRYLKGSLIASKRDLTFQFGRVFRIYRFDRREPLHIKILANGS